MTPSRFSTVSTVSTGRICSWFLFLFLILFSSSVGTGSANLGDTLSKGFVPGRGKAQYLLREAIDELGARHVLQVADHTLEHVRVVGLVPVQPARDPDDARTCVVVPVKRPQDARQPVAQALGGQRELLGRQRQREAIEAEAVALVVGEQINCEELVERFQRAQIRMRPQARIDAAVAIHTSLAGVERATTRPQRGHTQSTVEGLVRRPRAVRS